MTDREFENYLALLSGFLRLNQKQQIAISGELRDHLEERLASLIDDGVPREEAVRLALEEFGDASSLAEQFSSTVKSRRRTVGVWAVVGSIAAALVLMATLRDAHDSDTGLASRAIAQEPAEAKERQTYYRSGDHDAYLKMREQLSKPVSITFDQIPFNEAMQVFSTDTGIPVRIDLRSLDEAVVSPESPVTLNVSKISAQATLSLLLRELDLAFMVEDGMLVVTTPASCEQNLVTSLYPVSDLAANASNEIVDYETLIELCTSMVFPDSWDQVGGPGSIYGPYKGIFTVSQTANSHDALRDLIEAMRRLDGKSTDPITSGETDWRIQYWTKLRKPIDVELDKVDLTQAMMTVSELVGVPILVDRVGLEDAAINPDIPMTCTLKATPADVALRVMLGQVDLTYALRDEVIMITTREVEESLLTTRLYPVHDLVRAPKDLPKQELREFYAQELSSLRELILSSVNPDSWDEVGGPGAIGAFQQRSTLVVSQTGIVHRRVENLLATLRRAQKSQFAGADNPKSSQELQLVVYTTQSDPELLVKAIQNYVSPTSWGSDAPDTPSIMAIRDASGADTHKILVRHRGSVHRQIRNFLMLLDQQTSSRTLFPDGSTAPSPGLGGGAGGFF